MSSLMTCKYCGCKHSEDNINELKARVEELEQALRLINGAACNIYWEIEEPKKSSEYINGIFKDTGVEYSS